MIRLRWPRAILVLAVAIGVLGFGAAAMLAAPEDLTLPAGVESQLLTIDNGTSIHVEAARQVLVRSNDGSGISDLRCEIPGDVIRSGSATALHYFETRAAGEYTVTCTAVVGDLAIEIADVAPYAEFVDARQRHDLGVSLSGWSRWAAVGLAAVGFALYAI